MISGLAEIGVDLEDAWFFITHLHADHFGLVARLATDPGRVYFSRPESEIIESWSGWEPMVRYAALNGFPEDQLRAALDSHPGFKYTAGWVPGTSILDDEDVVSFGPYNFRCIETPGHTEGHICLYEPERKVLISGDHILGDITPNIQCWRDDMDPLGDYLQSLDKVGRLDVDLTLPGHRTLIRDLPARIEELKAHHRRRLDEAENILQGGPRHAFAAAAAMTWDPGRRLGRFPVGSKMVRHGRGHGAPAAPGKGGAGRPDPGKRIDSLFAGRRRLRGAARQGTRQTGARESSINRLILGWSSTWARTRPDSPSTARPGRPSWLMKPTAVRSRPLSS